MGADRHLHAPEAYVHRMVTNEYLSWRRHRAARQVASTHETLETLARPWPTTPRGTPNATCAPGSPRCPQTTAALVLRYYENLSDAEIAEVLGCGAGTVRSHISRALTKLRAAEAAHARTTETVKGAHS